MIVILTRLFWSEVAGTLTPRNLLYILIKGSQTRRSFMKAAGGLAFAALTRSSEKLVAADAGGRPLRDRGYYLLFSRMPTFGLSVWREILDGFGEDGINTLILWIGGAFRSSKFPITWKWAGEHENVRHDFARELIDHAHHRKIQVLLGFTPFAYDGVNQYPLEHPELKAIGPDGHATDFSGIGSWGWNLCPSQPAAQQFMLEYAREMAFDFYPNADGLFLESSDYAICHCPDCGPKYYEREFAFVRKISDEVWQRNAKATVVVYPHYFSGAKLGFAEAVGSREPFDPRWTLFFTPHSAAIEPALVARASGAWWWNAAPSRFDLNGAQDGIRRAAEAGCSGYVPSLECYSYIVPHVEFGEPWLVNRRQVPFGFGWLADGQNPYSTLPVRAMRLAYDAWTADSALSRDRALAKVRNDLLGGSEAALADLLTLLEVFGTDRDWSVPAPLTTPGLVRDRLEHHRLTAEKQAQLADQLRRVQAIAVRWGGATEPGAMELGKIAQWLSDQWNGENQKLLGTGK